MGVIGIPVYYEQLFLAKLVNASLGVFLGSCRGLFCLFWGVRLREFWILLGLSIVWLGRFGCQTKLCCALFPEV